MLPHDLPVVPQKVPQPLPHRPGVQHRLGCREGLGDDDDQRLLRVQIGTRPFDVDGVDVAEEAEAVPEGGVDALRFGFQRLVEELGSQVAAPDADRHNVPQPLAGRPADRSGADAVRKGLDLIEDFPYFRDGVDGFVITVTFDKDRPNLIPARPQGRVQHRPLLRKINFLSLHHHGIHFAL